MAYRRRQGITRASTFKEEIYHQPPADDHNDFNVKRNPATFSSSYSFSSGSSPGSSLAAKAIRASAAHREASSFSTAYADSSAFEAPRSKGFNAYENESSRNDSKGFWGVLARKAKAILEDDNISQQFESSGRLRSQMFDASTGSQQSYQSPEGFRRMDNPTIRKGLDKLTSSLNQIGDTFEKAFEEGRTIVENKTADIIQETRKLQIRRKGSDTDTQNLAPGVSSSWQQPIELQNQNTHETQLKASRDVRCQLCNRVSLVFI